MKTKQTRRFFEFKNGPETGKQCPKVNKMTLIRSLSDPETRILIFFYSIFKILNFTFFLNSGDF